MRFMKIHPSERMGWPGGVCLDGAVCPYRFVRTKQPSSRIGFFYWHRGLFVLLFCVVQLCF